MSGLITVIINPDEKSAMCSESLKVYEILGLIIRKPKETKDAYYKLGTPMCNAVCSDGHIHHAEIVDKTFINIV